MKYFDNVQVFQVEQRFWNRWVKQLNLLDSFHCHWPLTKDARKYWTEVTCLKQQIDVALSASGYCCHQQRWLSPFLFDLLTLCNHKNVKLTFNNRNDFYLKKIVFYVGCRRLRTWNVPWLADSFLLRFIRFHIRISD